MKNIYIAMFLVIGLAMLSLLSESSDNRIEQKLDVMDSRFKSIHEITKTCKENEKFLFLAIDLDEYREGIIETFPLVMCSERETNHNVDNWK